MTNENKNKNCVIVAASPECCFDGKIPAESLVIAADGGYKYVAAAGIVPDVLIGDFDSLGQRAQTDIEVIALEREKDDTDTMAAAREGLKRGCKEFHIYGALGGRMDHAYANFQVLAFVAEKGARGFLYGDGYAVTCIKNGEIAFDENRSGTISVLSYSDVSRGVNIEGLKYPLCNAELSNTFPLGASNEFIGQKSVISVEDGTLLIIYNKQNSSEIE